MTTYADLVEVFEERGVIRIPVSHLDDTLLSEGVRRDLTDIGLPLDLRSAMRLNRGLTEGMTLYSDWCRAHELEYSDRSRSFFRLGRWRAGSVCMAPETGKIYYVSPYEETEIHLMNSSPGQLSTCMMITERDSEDNNLMSSDLAIEDRTRIIQLLIEVDPQAVLPEESVWRVIVEEVTGPEYRP